MFDLHIYGKKALHNKALKDLTSITPAAILLKENKRQQLVSQIKEFLFLKDDQYQNLCFKLINNLVKYVQSLPEPVLNYYSYKGGILDHALNRTEAALSILSRYVIKEGASYSEIQMLWQYTLFSASLVQSLGKLYADFIIGVYDKNGQYLMTWNPLIEDLLSLGAYYNYEVIINKNNEVRNYVNVIVACNIMPDVGFKWIASNPEILTIWLNLINDDTQNAGILGAILDNANAIALKRFLDLLFLKETMHQNPVKIGTFAGGANTTFDKDIQIGTKFIQWLTQELNSGRLMINQAPLFMVPGGMLISSDMFKLFVRENPEFKNWQIVQKGFLSLGLHQVTGGNTNFNFEKNNAQNLSGIVFDKYSMSLPDTVQVYNSNTKQTQEIAAIDLVNWANNSNVLDNNSIDKLSKVTGLSSSGQWLEQQVKSALGIEQRFQGF